MKTFLIFLILPVLAISGIQCRKKTIGDTIPVCIQEKIEQIKAMPKWNPPASVTQYYYRGQNVYLFSSDCCDRFNELYDNTCMYLCSPSGGISGTGDGACSNFFTTARYIRLVWKDNR